MRIPLLRSTVLLTALATAACGGGPGNNQQPQASGTNAPAASRNNASTDKSSYAVFPDADAGADAGVPADQGGKGFKGDGWQTNTSFDLIGDPRAVKGGVLRDHILDFPGTLRVYGAGPESNSQLNYMITSLAYEPLLGVHPTSLDYMPALATHWRISPDELTYWFRIDPNARWSDGQPVVADDVVATWVFLMDKGLQSPSSQLVFGKFEKPVAESKYIVRVKSKELNWRNFLYFSGNPILPAHVLKNITGAQYLKDYNFKLLPGTGPYMVSEADVVKGKSVTIRRRNDYWGEKHRFAVGSNNFDEIRETVVRDENLALEMFKRGDLDFYFVNISRQWVQDLNIDKVQRGLIQKIKVYNDYPNGFQGLGINMRKPPFDDIRVREALAYLFNRKLLIEKLFFNEYLPLNSYDAGGIYENKNNPKMEYDPQKAVALLAEAGWKNRDAQGRLVKDGQPFVFELQYTSKTAEPYLTIYQDDLRKLGIQMNLRLVTSETSFQLMMQRKFDIVSVGWGTAGPFPDHEAEFSGKLADVDNTNNITGVKNARIDQLLDAYGKEFNVQKRAAIIQEIDGILTGIHSYVLEWYLPNQRFAFYNKFGFPDGILTRTGDFSTLAGLWWVDPDKERALNQAANNPSMKLPIMPMDQRFWQQYGEQHPFAPNAGATK